MPDEAELVNSIFQAAAEKTADTRAAFLDQACNRDAALRQRVEELLAAHDQGSSNLESAAFEATTNCPLPPPPKPPNAEPGWANPFKPPGGAAPGVDAPAPAGVGTRIGAYKLLQKIGEGGMGTVWMAEQTEPVKRMVALKLIKPGMDSSQVLARFEAERQAIAMMDHPNIAKVLEAGAVGVRGQGSGVSEDQASRISPHPSLPTPDASPLTPFFVMELVRGIPITKYCDEHLLSPRERLELFVPVCQAIQHAHQKGIIHRDIKPSNVLIASYDGKPVPKVIDFGVAKATGQKLTERTMFTGFGGIVGTLEYMSPEQAEFNALDIDTRSDIYALGVLLYELLTGTTPLTWKRVQEATLIETLRLIREEDPPRPSMRVSESKEIMASLAARRRTEPAKLAKLMRGELDWLVMKALEKDRNRRYDTANSMALDIQRYLQDEPVLARPPSAAYRLRKFAKRNKGMLVAAAVVLLALVGGIVGTTWGLVEARQAQRNEAQQRLDAETQRDVALKATRKAQTEEANAIESAKIAKQQADERLAVLQFFRRRVLIAPQPKGHVGGLGMNVTIREALDAAEPTIAASFKDEPLVEAEIRTTLGLTYSRLGEAKLAVPQQKRALELFEKHKGPKDPDTLNAMGNLGRAYMDAGQFSNALALDEKALALANSLYGADQLETMSYLNNLASSSMAMGQLQKALELHKRTATIVEEKLGRRHPGTLHALNNLAETYVALGQFKVALPLLEETLKVRMSHPQVGSEHPDTLTSMSNLACAYAQTGRLEEALALHKKALDLRKATLGLDHPHTLSSMNNLALAYYKAGQFAEALALFEEALKLCTAKLGDDHPETLIAMNNLAEAYHEDGRLPKAAALHEKTLKLRQKNLGPTHPDTLQSMQNLALVYCVVDRVDEALELIDKVLKARQANLGPDSPMTWATMYVLAQAYVKAKRFDEAVGLYKDVLKRREASFGAEDADTLDIVHSLALAYYEADRYQEARPLLEKTLQVYQKKLGREDPATLLAMYNLAQIHLAAGNFKEALPLCAESLKLRCAKLGPKNKATLNSEKLFRAAADSLHRQKGFNNRLAYGYWVTLADCYEAMGQSEKAEPMWREQVDYWKGKEDEGALFNCAANLASLGSNLLKQAKFAGAEPILRECLAIRTKQDSEGWSTFNTASMLGGSLLGQKKYAEAEPLLVRGGEGMKQRAAKIPPSALYRLTDALERLVQLYEATGDTEKAGKWRKELEARKGTGKISQR